MDEKREAGPALDAEVAERVMGAVECPAWRLRRSYPVEYIKDANDCRHADCHPVGFVPFYSTNITAAWSVAMRFIAAGGAAEVGGDGHCGYGAMVTSSAGRFEIDGCDSAPLAICLAALAAVGAERQ